MTDLDITLTLSEYVRRMNSADASEWLPTPAEAVVMYKAWRVLSIEPLDGQKVRVRIDGRYTTELWNLPVDRTVTVSRKTDPHAGIGVSYA